MISISSIFLASHAMEKLPYLKKRDLVETIELSLKSPGSFVESQDSNCKDDQSRNEIDVASRASRYNFISYQLLREKERERTNTFFHG